MRRGITPAVLVVFCIALVPTPQTSAQTPANIWDSNFETSLIGDISSEKAAESPFCEYRNASKKRLIDPLGDLSFTDLLLQAQREELGEVCVFENEQGLFTYKNTQLLYSSQFTKNFYSLYPRIGSGVFEYMPAPSGEYVLSQFRINPFQGSARLGYHPSWREDTSLQRQGTEYYMRHVTSGFSLTFAGGEGYDITHDAYAFSETGRYVVVSRGPIIEKIDLKELRLTPIAYVTSPQSTRLAISNDGRYVAFGKNTYLNVADTQGCDVSFERGTWQKTNQLQYQGCQISGDITDSLFDNGLLSLANAHDFSRPYFSTNGSTVSLTASYTPSGQTGVVREEYSIRANDYVSTASGYIALGDSFSSGEGDTEGGEWYEPGTDEQGDITTFAGRNLCHLSRRSYPYLMAVELGYLSSNTTSPPEDGLFRSVACSGATIRNIIGGAQGVVDENGGSEVYSFADNQYRFSEFNSLGVYQPGYRNQIAFISEEELVGETLRKRITPEVITVGIAGNDADFGGFLQDCLGIGDCIISEPGSEEASRLGIRIAAQKENLVRTYKKIKGEAPDARVYVHGYPQFVSDREDNSGVSGESVCGVNVRLSQREREMAVAGVSYMNDVVEAAAKEAGVFYTDIENILEGGRLCDEASGDEILVNGITAGNDIDFSLCIMRTGCFGSETYHPKPSGHQKYSERILLSTNNLSESMPEAQPQAIPDPPSIFGDATSEYVQNQNSFTIDETVIPVPSQIVGVSSNKDDITIAFSGLYAGSDVEVEIRSTPTDLGTFSTDENGQINQTIPLPDGFEPGVHTLYLKGIDRLGERITLYQSVYIATSEEDFDGDGVLNSNDTCPTVTNSNVDKDEDGVDDSCDEEVIEPEEPPVEPEPEPKKKSFRQRLRAFFKRIVNWFFQNWQYDFRSSSRRWRW